MQRKLNFTPHHFCVAEDILLLKGGVLNGFTGIISSGEEGKGMEMSVAKMGLGKNIKL